MQREATVPAPQKPTPYNAHKWRKRSKQNLRDNPFCEVWLALGRSVKADVTDHIVRVEAGGGFWLRKNYMSMSHFWHNRKRNLEAKGLTLKSIDVRGGKIPADRNEIIRILIDKFNHERNI